MRLLLFIALLLLAGCAAHDPVTCEGVNMCKVAACRGIANSVVHHPF